MTYDFTNFKVGDTIRSFDARSFDGFNDISYITGTIIGIIGVIGISEPNKAYEVEVESDFFAGDHNTLRDGKSRVGEVIFVLMVMNNDYDGRIELIEAAPVSEESIVGIELSTPEPDMFHIYEIVYFMNDNAVASKQIGQRVITERSTVSGDIIKIVKYTFRDGNNVPDNVFRTKQELLESL